MGKLIEFDVSGVAEEDGVPVLPAFFRDDGVLGWRVWCDFCDCWHNHGIDAGHRVAHCHDKDSPYQDTGYTLGMSFSADEFDDRMCAAIDAWRASSTTGSFAAQITWQLSEEHARLVEEGKRRFGTPTEAS